MLSEQKNRSWIVGKERVEKKMTSSTTYELEKHLEEKGRTELLENQQRKD